MADLITSAEAKRFLNIEHTDDDTLISELVAFVSAFVENYCNREFSSESRTEYLDGGGENLTVSHPPITGVTGIYDTWDSDEEVDSDDYSYDGNAGLIYLDTDSAIAKWMSGRRRWKVVYVGGFSTIPDDVKAACLTWCADIYNRRDALQNESLGGYSFSAEALPGRVKIILEKHKLMSF